jgi:hypothetical protein
MQSFLCPPCGVCGGFTEKVLTQAPSVIHQQQEAPEPEPETHHCGSGCVLHRQYQPQAMPTEPD